MLRTSKKSRMDELADSWADGAPTASWISSSGPRVSPFTLVNCGHSTSAKSHATRATTKSQSRMAGNQPMHTLTFRTRSEGNAS
jgi:hypothetical protein